MSASSSTARVIFDGVRFAIVSTAASLAAYYMVQALVHAIEGSSAPSASEKQQPANDPLLKFKERNPGVKLRLTKYESALLSEVVSPDDIKVKFTDIGGLEDIIDDLRESVLYPLTMPGFFANSSPLLQAPKGVLLYGPPGCGKTMLAKALACESGATFLNIKLSTIADKWFGESNKIVNAIFTLARKLQPCIIFIDEIDSFLRERSSGDHEAMAMLKAEFMTLWDGLTTDGRILVLGATNRANDIDSAFLRRMPKRFAVRLPDLAQRKKLLSLMLSGTVLDSSFEFDELAMKTSGMSGSDIKEACRDAVMVCAREFFKDNYTSGKIDPTAVNPNDLKMRPLRITDFFVKTAATSMHANTYSVVSDVSTSLD
ncbi:P-loop containing nucleoside triphosphate hydrolase protein [Limtongia smithiae]|uniref:P-loop containing nucleoside triphosphate hydrolase protein n=1 Tax=Limtongia smithiae TaxID=1125753 RepID=UPI0034CDC5FE